MFSKLVFSVISSLLIYTYFNVTFINCVGLYAFHCWCIENVESVVQILIHLARKYLFPRKCDSLKNQFGEWAVITGSTDGIGYAYAKQLASKGLNIVLVSRFAPKLAKVASQIESTYGVETKCITVDFNDGNNVYDSIEDELRELPIGILVNCVGRMYDHPDEVGNVTMEVLWSLINLNMGAMVTMTRIVINCMKERKKGAIINISSGSELQPCPYITVYAATKAFVRHFTLGLQYELAPYNICVQLITPFCIRTKLHAKYPIKEVIGNIFFPHVDTFVKSALFTLGKTPETTGYLFHSLMNVAMRSLPVYIRTFVMSQLAQKIQKAYLKDQKKQMMSSNTKPSF